MKMHLHREYNQMSYINNIKNRLLNSKNPFFQGLNAHILYYPTPINLSYSWGFGSQVGLFFALQLVTGILLAMHYTCHTTLAFSSVDHIMSDVQYGYIFRYAHANGASMIFILLYLHIARGLYYQSYLNSPWLWVSGLVLFLLMMATAFIGYVLPWGQMSFWGATVITSLVTAVPVVGDDIAYWIWGGFSINNATLTRFFSLHYLLPFLILGIILLHLVLLHVEGSACPQAHNRTVDKITFHPYFTYKDGFMFTFSLLFFVFLVFYYPNYLGHTDNFIPANPLVTPPHIVPEWYFTPFYAILRACPSKIGGAISMLLAILVLFILIFYGNIWNRAYATVGVFSSLHKFMFWCFVSIFLILMYLGCMPAAAPFITYGRIFSILYFAYLIIVIPTVLWLDNQILNGNYERSAPLRTASAAKTSEHTIDKKSPVTRGRYWPLLANYFIQFVVAGAVISYLSPLIVVEIKEGGLAVTFLCLATFFILPTVSFYVMPVLNWFGRLAWSCLMAAIRTWLSLPLVALVWETLRFEYIKNNCISDILINNEWWKITMPPTMQVRLDVVNRYVADLAIRFPDLNTETLAQYHHNVLVTWIDYGSEATSCVKIRYAESGLKLTLQVWVDSPVSNASTLLSGALALCCVAAPVLKVAIGGNSLLAAAERVLYWTSSSSWYSRLCTQILERFVHSNPAANAVVEANKYILSRDILPHNRKVVDVCVEAVDTVMAFIKSG